jgi:hypothetical protein
MRMVNCSQIPTIMDRWKNYFSRLFNVHRVINVRQIGIHTAKPLVPDPSPFEVGIAIAKLKSIKRQVVTKFRQK